MRRLQCHVEIYELERDLTTLYEAFKGNFLFIHVGLYEYTVILSYEGNYGLIDHGHSYNILKPT